MSDIISINVIEVASELAHNALIDKHGCVEMLEINGVMVYTEKDQDVFNELYDYYYSFLLEYEHKQDEQ
jgi:hypothetical protein